MSSGTEINRANDGLIEMLGTILGRRTFAAGERIFSQGDPATEAYAVLKGSVEIRIVNAKGQDIVLTTLTAGTFFGEMALIMHGPRTATAVTREGCEVLVLPRQMLDAKIATTSPFLKLWIEMLAARVVAASARAG